MTPIDDLNVGDLVCVVEYKGPKHCRHCGDFSGHPHTIEAISLPFLALNDGGEMHSLDVRVWSVRRVTKEYARAMYHGEVQPRDKRQKPDPMTCTRCGDRYIERMSAMVGSDKPNGKSKLEWRWWCRSCHHDAGPTNKQPERA